LVRCAAQSQGAEHAARARELCVLGVVGLEVLETRRVLANEQLGLDLTGLKSSRAFKLK